MFKLLSYVRNQLRLGSRLREERGLQAKGGYEITFAQEGPQRSITYRENGKEVTVQVEFTWLNDVTLYINSFKVWDRPRGEKLNPFEYEKVTDRLVRFLSCWGDVTLDSSPLERTQDLKESLIEQGIPFEELEDGIVHYISTVERERERKGGFFNEK